MKALSFVEALRYACAVRWSPDRDSGRQAGSPKTARRQKGLMAPFAKNR